MKRTEKKFTVKLVLRIIALCAVVLFLAYNIYLWNVQSMQGVALPMPFGVGTAVVLSGSMEPALSVDDLIVVIAREDYQVDDVVVYQSGSSLVVHRIVGIDEGMVTTQGDANNVPDDPVDSGTIKGAVVGRIRNMGRAVRLMKAPTVSFCLTALAIYLMERSFRREKADDDQKMEKLQEEIQRLKAEQEP